MVGVAKTEGADEYPVSGFALAAASLGSHLLAHHRVPHGGRVARALVRVPRTRRRRVRRREARLHELALGRHLTRGGVDEEDRHGFAG